MLALAIPSLFIACTETPVPKPDSGDDGPHRLTILHTNDSHSHMLGFGPNAEYTPDTTGDDTTVGGLARMQTLVDQIKEEKDNPVVLYDAGDWMDGDVFQLLATTDAAELSMKSIMNYDAVTIGNHEFDWGPNVLGQIIDAADAAGHSVPLVASNIVPNPADAGDDTLEALFTSGRIETTRVQELDNGLRIGLFGLIGDEAQSITPAIKPSSFLPAIDVSTDAVAALKADGVDIIVGITHNGVTDDPATSPDELLAAAVPDIDVLVGGHSHTPLFESRTVGKTTIVQAGSMTQYLGELNLLEGEDGVWGVESYTLHELDDTIAGDAAVTAAIDGYKTKLDAGPLATLGYDFAEPMFAVGGDLPAIGCAESGLGDFISDAYRSEMNRLDPDADIEFTFESQGVIRDGIAQGHSGVQGFSDVFRVLPLGFGTDDVPGYALVDFYVTGHELKDVCEVSASISPTYGCNYFIEVSGMRCNIDMSHGEFNRAQSIERQMEDGTWEEIDSTKEATQLYHVAVDSYVASLMGILGKLTYTLIVITPKDADGNEYTSTTDMLFDGNPATPEVDEVKLWQTLIGYGGSFPDTTGDGISDLPAAYLSSGGRIVGM